MCLIIANFDGRTVPIEYLVSAYRTNDDGFGIMWVEKNRNELKVQRGMFDLDKIIETVNKRTKEGVPYVAHFRTATMGTVDQRNCHPFIIGEFFGGTAMAHNGSFSPYTWRGGVESDTNLFAQELRNALNSGNISPRSLFVSGHDALRRIFKNHFESYNKVAFMNGDGQISLINEHAGYWVNGVWYSNLYSIGAYNTNELREKSKVFTNINICHDRKSLDLVLSDKFDLDDYRKEIDEDFDPEDSPDTTIELEEDDLEYDLSDYEDNEDTILENFVTHPLAEANGHSSAKDDDILTENQFWFDGVIYDMSNLETTFSKEEIHEMIEDEKNGSEVAHLFLEDIAKQCHKVSDADDLDEGEWKNFIRAYQGIKNKKEPLKLPATTPTIITQPSTNNSTNNFDDDDVYGSGYTFGATSGYQHRGTNYSSSGTGYYNREYYYYDKNNPYDQIVEALLKM